MSQIIEYVYLGGVLDATDKDALKRKKIVALVTVCRAFELPDFTFRPPGVRDFLRLDVEDRSDEPIEASFYEAADFIDAHVLKKEAVLIHCKSGVSRSATIAIAYLMIKKNFDLHGAFFHVRTKRQIISPIPGFMSQLCKLETEIVEAAAAALERTPKHPEPEKQQQQLSRPTAIKNRLSCIQKYANSKFLNKDIERRSSPFPTTYANPQDSSGSSTDGFTQTDIPPDSSHSDSSNSNDLESTSLQLQSPSHSSGSMRIRDAHHEFSSRTVTCMSPLRPLTCMSGTCPSPALRCSSHSPRTESKGSLDRTTATLTTFSSHEHQLVCNQRCQSATASVESYPSLPVPNIPNVTKVPNVMQVSLSSTESHQRQLFIHHHHSSASPATHPQNSCSDQTHSVSNSSLEVQLSQYIQVCPNIPANHHGIPSRPHLRRPAARGFDGSKGRSKRISKRRWSSDGCLKNLRHKNIVCNPTNATIASTGKKGAYSESSRKESKSDTDNNLASIQSLTSIQGSDNHLSDASIIPTATVTHTTADSNQSTNSADHCHHDHLSSAKHSFRSSGTTGCSSVHHRRSGPTICIVKYIDWYSADEHYRAAVPDLDA